MQQDYQIKSAPAWAGSPSDEELKAMIVDTPFSEKQMEEGRDYCYFLHKINYVDDESRAEYAAMAYTLSQPENLERASAYDIVLEENEFFEFHRISVLRDGQLIDKLPDMKIKVFDNEDQSERGVINKSKKINVSIKNLRLYDVLIMEDTRTKIFTEKEFVRRDFTKHIYITPDTYWAYGKYFYQFINERNQKVAYKKFFFRDEEGNLLPNETQYLNKGERFVINKTDYINPVDTNREIFPFIDFATESNWKALSNYIFPFYDEAIKKANIKDFAPDLVTKLDSFDTLDQKLQYAIEYVQNNIYYTYNADEMNGHKPQEPSVTYQNKQGDCKAKSVLMKVILDYLDVPSEIVLVNYRADFYLKYYMPSLLSFNHVIVKINYKGEDYFVDVTSRNEFGRLEKRSVISFCHYMEIGENQELKVRKPQRFSQYALSEKVRMEVKDGVGNLTLTTTYRFGRANALRNSFKSSNKKEMIDGWNKMLYYCLNYVNDRSEQDIRSVFKDAHLQIVKDNKTENEFVVEYRATVEKPYFTDKQGNDFLMYFDHHILKKDLLDFHHTDRTFFHDYDSEYYEIELIADQNIDTKEKYTIQELDLKTEFFDYKITKDIQKKSGKATILYNPVTNIEIPLEKIPQVREDYFKITDSNFGLGIDVLKKGFFNKLKRLITQKNN